MIDSKHHVTTYVILGKKCEEGGIVTQCQIADRPIGDFIEIPGGSNGEVNPVLMIPVVKCPYQYPPDGYFVRYWEYEPKLKSITRQKVCVKDSGGQSVEFTTIPPGNTCKAHRRARDLTKLFKDGPTGEKDCLLRRPEVKAFFCCIALHNTITILSQEAPRTSLTKYLLNIGAVEREQTTETIHV